ncbi:probable glutamate receptor [Penaeus chinensis]|uniref:probable glutamate receptor n=1 Tax=Penaeus chinensis TaxID=139456 RepID=UPI001FB79D6A|nr:probable glutamate receptor [Penaeus chinensis]
MSRVSFCRPSPPMGRRVQPPAMSRIVRSSKESPDSTSDSGFGRGEPKGLIHSAQHFSHGTQQMKQLLSAGKVIYTCHHVRDGQWGSKVNGKWNGMMKELLEGTADIAVSPMSIT